MDHVQWKRSCKKRSKGLEAVAKPGLTNKKVMLCVLRDCNDFYTHELLQPSQTIDSDIYCQRLIRLSEAIRKSRLKLTEPRGVFL